MIANSVHTGENLYYPMAVLFMGTCLIGLNIYAIFTGKVIGNGFVGNKRDSLFGYPVGLVTQLGVGVF